MSKPASDAAWRPVVQQLLFSVFVVDAQAPKAPVIASNAALDTLVGEPEAVHGRPVDDVVDGRVSLPDGAGEALGDLFEEDGVWGIAEGLWGPRRQRSDVLHAMATDLVAKRPLEDILSDVAMEAGGTAGARRAAIMFSDGSDEFDRTDATAWRGAVADRTGRR